MLPIAVQKWHGENAGEAPQRPRCDTPVSKVGCQNPINQKNQPDHTDEDSDTLQFVFDAMFHSGFDNELWIQRDHGIAELLQIRNSADWWRPQPCLQSDPRFLIWAILDSQCDRPMILGRILVSDSGFCCVPMGDNRVQLSLHKSVPRVGGEFVLYCSPICYVLTFMSMGCLLKTE